MTHALSLRMYVVSNGLQAYHKQVWTEVLEGMRQKETPLLCMHQPSVQVFNLQVQIVCLM